MQLRYTVCVNCAYQFCAFCLCCEAENFKKNNSMKISLVLYQCVCCFIRCAQFTGLGCSLYGSELIRFAHCQMIF